MKVIFFALFFALIAGCQDNSPQVSAYPMINEGLGEGPWQVVTYEGDKVLHETINLDGASIVVRSESVYVDSKSQFVYRDGTPVKTYDGASVYWNNAGQIINRELQVIPEDQLFVVNKRPMARNMALRVRFSSVPIDNFMKAF